jgi:hypothetical protein
MYHMDQKQKHRRALRAQRDDLQDRNNLYGVGRPSGQLGTAPKRKGRPTGYSRAAIIRRLRRYNPELHQLVLEGTLTPRHAAILAGFLRRPGEPKHSVVVPIAAAITPLQEQELWLGSSHRGSAFASDEERRRLWVENRDLLMRRWANAGTRPQAFWKYDSPIPFPGPARERSTLWAAGLLGKQEMRALEVYWREEFKRAMQPDFMYVVGPGEIYQGAIAREKYFAWADIPSALVQQWEAARQRAD